MTERRPVERPVGVASERSEPRGFRPASRRRSRIAAGAILAAIAIGGNILLFAALDDASEVLQVSRAVRAGSEISADDLRIVEVDVDPTVPVIGADQIGRVVGQYARTFLPEGSLIVDNLIQPRPLVDDDAGVVAVQINTSLVPTGLTERSLVLLVIVEDGAAAPFTTTARVVTSGKGLSTDAGQAMSVEVAVADAPRVAIADDVRLVLLDPATDPVVEGGG